MVCGKLPFDSLSEMLGAEARSLWTPDGETGWTAGCSGCVSITIYCEHGEMAAVPYARVVYDDGRESRVNVKHYDVELFPPNQGPDGQKLTEGK